jgi:Uma2 family endonuclease
MAVSSPLEKSMSVPSAPIWRLSVAQYHHMIQSGILTDNDPVELLEGWLVTKMPKNPRHTLATQLSHEILARIVPSGWFVNVQEPITTADSEPEPDIAVIRGDRRDYSERHPSPSDVGLVIEVADATLQQDRTLKLRLYANARIPIYWILNLQDRQLDAHIDPVGEGEQAIYAHRIVYVASQDVPLVLDGEEIGRISLEDLLS